MKIVIVVILLSLAAIAGLLIIGVTDKSEFETPDRDPIDGSTLPNSAIKAVCLLGWPVMVKYLDKDLPNRLVIFPGPFKESWHESAKVFNYAGYDVSSPPNQYGDPVNLLQSFDKMGSLPQELVDYQFITLDGIPEQLPEVERLLGKADTVITRSKPARERFVWGRKLCFGKRLIYGLWVEVIDNKVIKAKGISSQQGVDKLL